MPEVTFVGTSDAFGAAGRRQTAILIRGSEGTVLLDCGPTTNTGLAQLGVPRDAIDAIVISHFHGDHFGGIPLLLLGARYEDERTKPIRIAGPRGVEARVRRLAEAMAHPFDQPDWTYPVIFTELEPGTETDVGPVTVRVFEVHHNRDASPHALDVDVDGKRIVYSGDTGWFDELPARVKGADLFICECNFCERDYEYHLNYRTLSARKSEFDCKRMILTHLSEEMAHLRSRCDFETADDGMKIKL
jgi:ribonuclease BN (tRNA processing enzyme)